MKIKRSSWHYRIVSRFGWGAPDNFCPYMRKLTALLVLMLFLVPSALYGMGEVIALVVMGKEAFKEVWLNGYLVEWGGTALSIHGIGSLVAGVICWLVIAVMGCVWAAETIGETKTAQSIRRKFRSRGVVVRKEPGVFRQWLTAMHDKACPILEFVNDDGEVTNYRR